MTDKKKFGLVMPKKSDVFKVTRNSVFDDDSDEDERVNKRPKIPQKNMELKSFVEDPSIYDYDGIYDEMKRQQTETISQKEKKNSRYIETLVKAADKRKKEYERRIDKKIQAEREKEGDKYKDKEAFVTSSYKKKMMEQEEEEQKEIRENMLNDMMDVTKQKDLSGFYRHFLKQTVGEEKVPQFGEKNIKDEVTNSEVFSYESSEKYENVDRDSDNVEIGDNESQNSSEELSIHIKRVSSERDGQNIKQTFDPNKPKKLHFYDKKYHKKSRKHSNLRSSSSESEDNLPAEKDLQSDKISEQCHSTNLHNSRCDSHSLNEDVQVNEKTTNTDAECNKIKQKNSNIYKKHTVGNIYAEAQARYFQRMATKN